MRQSQVEYKIIYLSVVLKDRLWGGRFLGEKYTNKANEIIGEAWVCSGHLNGQSIIMNGPAQGKNLNDFYLENPSLFSKKQHDRFPLLIKVIDAVDDLSVQVHPHDAYAKLHHNDLGKNECWYILKAEPKAAIVFGIKAKSQASLQQAITNNKWQEVLKFVPVKEGEFYYIPTGTVHAIGAGLQILEIQQSSDTTYRLYDYDRKDQGGNPRELHLHQALEVINYQTKDPIQHFTEYNQVIRLVDTPFFTVDKWAQKATLIINQQASFTILFANKTAGTVEIDGTIERVPEGHAVIITTAVKSFKIQTEGEFFLIKEQTVALSDMYRF